jgi:hypothetical protein
VGLGSHRPGHRGPPPPPASAEGLQWHGVTSP